jgi:hypothetical protein
MEGLQQQGTQPTCDCCTVAVPSACLSVITRGSAIGGIGTVAALTNSQRSTEVRLNDGFLVAAPVYPR